MLAHDATLGKGTGAATIMLCKEEYKSSSLSEKAWDLFHGWHCLQRALASLSLGVSSLQCRWLSHFNALIG